MRLVNTCLVFGCVVAMTTSSSFGATRVFMVKQGEQNLAPSSGNTQLTMSPGEAVDIEIWIEDTTQDDSLSAYSYEIPAEATATTGEGTVSYVDTNPPPPPFGVGSQLIDTSNPDFVFFGNVGQGPFYFEDLPNSFAGTVTAPPVPCSPVVIDSLKYLGEFQFEASNDACGDFELSFIAEETTGSGADCTGLFEIGELQNLTIAIDVPCAGVPPEIVHGDGGPGETSPCSGYIDPRVESNNGVALNEGIDGIQILFTQPVFKVGGGALTPSDFEVTETGGGTPPTIVAVATAANPLISLRFSRKITLKEWTTVRAIVQNGAGDLIPNPPQSGPLNEPNRVDIGFLPTDVNNDGASSPFDLLFHRQITNNIVGHPCGTPEHYTDINRDGSQTPFDLLVLRQLLNGISPPATQPWSGESMNNPRP